MSRKTWHVLLVVLLVGISENSLKLGEAAARSSLFDAFHRMRENNQNGFGTTEDPNPSEPPPLDEPISTTEQTDYPQADEELDKLTLPPYNPENENTHHPINPKNNNHNHPNISTSSNNQNNPNNYNPYNPYNVNTRYNRYNQINPFNPYYWNNYYRYNPYNLNNNNAFNPYYINNNNPYNLNPYNNYLKYPNNNQNYNPYQQLKYPISNPYSQSIPSINNPVVRTENSFTPNMAVSNSPENPFTPQPTPQPWYSWLNPLKIIS